MADPEQHEAWDFERAQKRPPVREPRAVVSVAFSRKDFERVSLAAQRLLMRTSEFIRAAALEKASGQPTSALASYTVSLGVAIFTEKPMSEARTAPPVDISGALAPGSYTALAEAPV